MMRAMSIDVSSPFSSHLRVVLRCAGGCRVEDCPAVCSKERSATTSECQGLPILRVTVVPITRQMALLW